MWQRGGGALDDRAVFRVDQHRPARRQVLSRLEVPVEARPIDAGRRRAETPTCRSLAAQRVEREIEHSRG